ncbi:hypothetical protein ACIA8O_11140 [Kitasatospora sp. NPDC051853]|uniref:hypothetical protein n=1 Tax=Kitasatospora sp. NPDC051853 TaxID=3364058 RepID=UPI003790B8AD
MKTPVFRRFAKNITISLAALTSLGLAGCSTAQPAAPAAAAPTTAAPPQPAAAKPALVQPVAVKDTGVVATFAGIGEDTRAQVGGAKVAFQVVWTNNTGKRVTNVMPVVSAQGHEGDPCTEIMPMVQVVRGTLERKNQNDWIKTGLSQGTGMDHALNGRAGQFGLNPGESRTVEYRFQPTAGNGTGRLNLEAQAFDGTTADSTFGRLGKSVVQQVQVVDAHRPTAALTGGTSTRSGEKVFTLRGANRTGATMAKAAPTLRMVEKKDSVGGLRPEYVVAQVEDGNGWRELPVRENCGWVEVDTTSLAGPLAAGAQHDHTFRIGTGRARDLDYAAGAVGDRHPSAPVTF